MSAAEIAALLSNAEVTGGEIRRAAIHLPKPLRAALYDETSPEHRTASGKFFEALVYEILLAESEAAPAVSSIAAQMSDAQYVPYDKYAKDGLWYSKDGGIRFKVSGRVAAEVDFLVKTADGVRIFGEVIVNPAKAGHLASEVAEKRSLLERLYGCEVQFLLVCAEPVKEPKYLRESDAVAVLESGNLLYQRLHPNEVLHKKSAPAKSTRRVDGSVW